MPRQPQGAGSIYRHKNGKWIAQIDLGRDKQGKRRRKARTATTKKEAQAKLRALEAEYNRSALNNDQNAGETVQTYLERWFEHEKPRWSPRTTELYNHQLRMHVYPRLGILPLAALKPVHVQEFMSGIVREGKIPTANKCRRMLYTALKQAVRWELIDKNPVEAVDPIPETLKELELWTGEQAARFIENNLHHRHYAAFYLLITSGLRRGELLGLRWEDVGDEGVYVRQTVTVLGNKPTIGVPKTRTSRRYLALPKDALEVLKRHKLTQNSQKELVGDTWSRPDLVFPSEIGSIMDPRNFLRSFKKAVRDAGLPDARIHDMRHLHISLLIYIGEDAKTVSDRAGHSSTSFTLDRYGHVFKEQRQRAAHPLSTLLSRPQHSESQQESPIQEAQDELWEEGTMSEIVERGKPLTDD